MKFRFFSEIKNPQLLIPVIFSVKFLRNWPNLCLLCFEYLSILRLWKLIFFQIISKKSRNMKKRSTKYYGWNSKGAISAFQIFIFRFSYHVVFRKILNKVFLLLRLSEQQKHCKSYNVVRFRSFFVSVVSILFKKQNFVIFLAKIPVKNNFWIFLITTVVNVKLARICSNLHSSELRSC